MAVVRALVETLASAFVAAMIAGAVEGARVAGEGGAGLGTWAVLAALACAGALVAGGAFALVCAGFARVPPFSAWLRDLAAGGAARAVAVWRAILVAAAIAVLAAGSFATARWAHVAFRFIDGGPVGLLVAGVVTPLAAALVWAALALDRRAVARLATGRAAAALTGRGAWIAAALAAIAGIFGPPLALRLAAPAIDVDGVRGASLLAVAVIVLAAIRAGRRRGVRIAAGLSLAACAIGVLALASAGRARGLLVVHGVFSRVAARAVWSLADRDGDGYAPASVGGADCDDTDARRHPTATEVAGNGIDENCTGADAPAAALAERAAPRPAAADPAPRHNIVMITVDALRADRLGVYGNRRPTSPAIDAFAATAARFAWAFTPCPVTRCSIPPLMTGRLPSVVDGDAPTLAAALRAAGWDTAAVTCCDRFSLGQRDAEGFAYVDTSADTVRVRRAGQSNADTVADGALRWFTTRPPSTRPFFLWLHFYDTHYPYEAPEAPTRFGGGDLDRYDAEIAFADRHIARVLAALDPATTIVVLSADHGEEFAEHGTRFHARSLFNQVVRIPMLIRYPGAAPRVITGPVTLADVMPTLLDLVGVAGPPWMNGRTLAASIRTGADPAPRPLLLELVPDRVISRDMAAVVFDGWKIIWDREANAWSLFSLAADPADERDVAAAHPAVFADLRRRLLDALDRELARAP